MSLATALAPATATSGPDTERPLPSNLTTAFAPPAEYAGKLSPHTSPLKFYDGRPVTTRADWPVRRQEILRRWHEIMGPWPALLEQPKLEILETESREGIVQHRIQIEVSAGVFQSGFLLIPASVETSAAGKAASPARRPAVFVPFYAPEVSVAYRGPRPLEGQAKKLLANNGGQQRDFALQLARRGFVTLAIGTPGDDAYKPQRYGAACQPLSHLAYLAANCHTALAQRPEVDPARIGVMGHSYGGKWAMFASCLYDKFAAAVWSDGGVVFDETRKSVNYWESWYLGFEPATTRKAGLVTADNPRTGAYKKLVAQGRDLHELHALMAPRPFLVSGGAEDRPARWPALNHAIAVNRFLGYGNRVAMTNREAHSPDAESNAQAFAFLEYFLRP